MVVGLSLARADFVSPTVVDTAQPLWGAHRTRAEVVSDQLRCPPLWRWFCGGRDGVVGVDVVVVGVGAARR